MPLFISVAMLRDPVRNRVFNHTLVTIAPNEAKAIEAAKADLARIHPTMELRDGSILMVEPAAIRAAYAELAGTKPAASGEGRMQ
jgi:hypothetical protein